MIFHVKTLLLGSLALATLPGLAQQTKKAPKAKVATNAKVSSSAGLPLTTKVPVDKAVKIGKLSNGLTYYIRKNQKPESKVELRLVVNAGSILEDDDQQGLAHFTEHMAFNGSEHFKKNELVSFLQSMGVEFGADLNAYTSFDETVYILPIPLSNPANLDKGMTVLRDWAGGLSFENSEIDAERGIILEESRLGKGAEDRMFRKIYPVQYEGSRYAERLPIGKDELLKTFKYDAIKRFYRDWYRPNLMAVMAVGDIDPAQVEAMIKAKFGGLKNPANPRPRALAALKNRSASRAMVVTDREATNYEVAINFPFASKKEATTLGEHRQDLVEQLFTTLLNQRFQEQAQSANPPFLYGYGYMGSFARGYEGLTLAAVAAAPGPDTAASALMRELVRVKQYGFSEAELERAKKSMMANYERGAKNKDKTESNQLIDEYVRHFLTGEMIPGIEAEYQYAQQLAPGITAAEVNAVGKKVDLNSPVFATLQGPEKAGTKLPTDQQLLASIQQASRATVAAYQEKALAASLLRGEPTAGTIVNAATNPQLGTNELKLSNGITVVMKPTDFQNDNIVLTLVRKGGTNRYGAEDKYNAQYATQVVGQMGYGNFAPVDMRKFMQGKIANVQPRISELRTSISGSSSVKDFEQMLQLVFAVATQPRNEPALFEAWRSKQKAAMQNVMANPQAMFIDSMFKVVYQNNPLAQIPVPKPEHFDAIDLARALQIYNRELGNMAGAYLFITGNVNPQTAAPLIAKYIGSLPTNGADAGNYTDNGVRPVSGRQAVNVYAGKEEKSLILNLYTGPVNYSEQLDLHAQMLNELLNIKLIEDLRERIGGIYGGGINGEVEQHPYPNYSFFMQLPCGPDNVEKLQAAVELELDTMRRFGPKEEDLNKVKQTRLEQHKVQLKQNGYWNGQMQDIYLDGRSNDALLDYERRINAVTTKDLQAAANLFFDGKNVVKAVLYPEKK